MSDLIKKHLTVDFDGEQFVFKIPTIQDNIRMGIRARDIRKTLVPESEGSDSGLDSWTVFLCESCATMELLLEQGPKWVFSTNKQGLPVVDSSKFDEDVSDKIAGVVLAFRNAESTFRKNRAANKNPVGAEAVAGQPTPQ